MKRDKELIHHILRHFEAQPTYGNLPYPEFDGVDASALAYHVHLCVQAGFLERSSTHPSLSIIPKHTISGLTWKGHELLDPNGCA